MYWLRLFGCHALLRQCLMMGAVFHCGFVVSDLAAMEDDLSGGKTLSSNLSNELGTEYKRGTFSGTAMIAIGNKIVFNQSYGYADQMAQIHNTQSTLSDIGSIAKTFTAAAILKLVEQEQVALTTSLEDIFDGVPTDKKAITVEALLSHTSGFDNFHNDTDFDQMSKGEALERIFALPLVAKPGIKIAYSNAAYTLLAAIVEQISGESFETVVRDELLTPLQLVNTGFYGDHHLARKQLAKGYGGDDEGRTTFEKGLTWALIGQGGMIASASDLYRWFSAILNHEVLDSATENLMLKVANKRWFLGNVRYFDSWGAMTYYAGGSNDFGYTSLAQYIPEQDVIIVLLLNHYGSRYQNATHQRLSKNHIMPILLSQQ